MNIIIPLGGKGERFSKNGYLQPKPLIPIYDKCMIDYVLDNLNTRIAEYQSAKKDSPKIAKYIWRDIILDLPDSYNFLSTWTGNYENLLNIYRARKNHKQREFREFCITIEELPYSKLITTER